MVEVMSYTRQSHLGQLGLGPELNSADVRDWVVRPGWSEPWLDAALRVSGIPSGQAARVPGAVHAVLTSTGAVVDRVAWGGGGGLEDYAGRVYVRWQPGTPENAITYADIARRLFAAAAEGFPAGSRIIMDRFRIDRTWPYEDLYVYPEGGGIPASAPEAARRTNVDDLPPPNIAPGTEGQLSARAGLSRPVRAGIGAGAAAVVILGAVAWKMKGTP